VLNNSRFSCLPDPLLHVDTALVLLLLVLLLLPVRPQLMRKILDTRDHGYRPLKEMVEAAHAGRAVAMEAACGDDTAMVVLPKNAPAAQPLLQLSQEGVELQAPPRKRARKSNGLPPKDAQRLQLPLEMAEALLAAYDDVRQQHHQQQQQQPQPDATAAAAAAAAAGTGSAGEERALLPKEAFVLQLVRECCGPASALKEEEKVVIFSQVGWLQHCCIIH
jgi:hypothetical protein